MRKDIERESQKVEIIIKKHTCDCKILFSSI